ncbi:surfeit locus protein 6-domain-containing protein [Phlebopus sp. FC_14]|nr:surfeit locus protein 6-domain-containing protein [Phlebopus sp. FC_14]
MSISAEVLRTSIEAHNDTFEALLRLIPHKYYLVKDETTHGVTSNKYQKHSRNQKAPKQAVKEASKKARRDKLDPANQKSVVDLQHEAALQEERAEIDKKGKGKQKHPSLAASSSSSDDDDAMQVDAFDHSIEKADEDIVPMPQTGSITVLREKLHMRMAALRHGGRGEQNEPGNKDELLEERRKQRAALREKRRKETRERKRAEAERQKGKGKGKDKDAKGKVPSMKSQLVVPDMPPASSAQASSQEYNGPLTNVAFSTLAGASISKNAAQLRAPANPTQALTKLAARKGKLAALPEEKRKAVEERERWARAEARVEGVKIKDNEGQLKKAIKRKDKEKARSKKNWEERKEQLAASMAAKQKKRADNIAMRNERRSEKRKDISNVRSKARPGFEGKSFAKGKGKSVDRKK